MTNPIFEDLNTKGFISDESLKNIRKKNSTALFSIHWELKILLYLGVILLSTGLGILVYKNIDSIGHQAVVVAIGLISFACFTWCYRNKLPFSTKKVESPDSLSDYILLLGALSFLSFVGYLQFQFEIYGTRYGLATFIPMLFLFFTAYYFDHLGLLTMAIANLAIWMGVSVTPTNLLVSGDFNNLTIIYTYLNLGLLLLAMALASRRYLFKKHFSFTYQHFGIHLTFIALISGYFHHSFYPALTWFLAIMIAAGFIFQRAFREKSFYFVLITVLYAYIAVSGLVSRMLNLLNNTAATYLTILYFIVSGLGLILTLLSLNKRIKSL
jgi:hypothetical protein